MYFNYIGTLTASLRVGFANGGKEPYGSNQVHSTIYIVQISRILTARVNAVLSRSRSKKNVFF